MREARVRRLLEENDLAAIVVDAPLDLYYLTGLSLSLGRLILKKERGRLYVDGRYFEVCQGLSPFPVTLTDWKVGSEFDVGSGRVGFDADATSVAAFEKLKRQVPGELVPLSRPIQKLRAVKDTGEIAKLQLAAKLGEAGCAHVVGLLEEGVSEKELAAALEIFWKQRGGERPSFDPIIAFGEGTSQPHYKVSDRKLKKGDPVLIDCGVVVDHYHSDMTRVVFFGKPDPKMEEIYQVVESALEAALALCLSGVPIKEVDHAARLVIKEAGFGEYFPHSLGHGIGLETHELPILRSTTEGVLEAGMCVTVEPGVYLPKFGGVRLEEMVVIMAEGPCQLLTNRGDS